MPLRTRGAGQGVQSEAEEAEEEEGVKRPGLYASAPFGPLSTLPSWPCMDRDGESRMLLPRG